MFFFFIFSLLSVFPDPPTPQVPSLVIFPPTAEQETPPPYVLANKYNLGSPLKQYFIIM